MKCQKCNTREATENWLGEGSTMDYIHGNYQRWCKRSDKSQILVFGICIDLVDWHSQPTQNDQVDDAE